MKDLQASNCNLYSIRDMMEDVAKLMSKEANKLDKDSWIKTLLKPKTSRRQGTKRGQSGVLVLLLPTRIQIAL
jgi:hypothetical protein